MNCLHISVNGDKSNSLRIWAVHTVYGRPVTMRAARFFNLWSLLERVREILSQMSEQLLKWGSMINPHTVIFPRVRVGAIFLRTLMLQLLIIIIIYDYHFF